MSDTFFRVHTTALPFSAENAWSGLWGADFSEDGSQSRCCHCDGSGEAFGEECKNCNGEGWEDCLQGYSCCDSAEELLEYFQKHGHTNDDTPVVIFEGEYVGNGFDGEPLAVPTKVVRWTTFGELENES